MVTGGKGVVTIGFGWLFVVWVVTVVYWWLCGGNGYEWLWVVMSGLVLSGYEWLRVVMGGFGVVTTMSHRKKFIFCDPPT